jgi:thiamine biosynthesis lipoprotein
MDSETYLGSVYNHGLLYTWFTAMHTRVDVLLHGKPEVESQTVIRRIAEKLQQLEKMANYFDPASELSHLNKYGYLQPLRVSGDLFRMISLCIEYTEKTKGCFDITIHSQNHTSETVQSILLDEEHSTVYFNRQGVCLDLSGFLKGYALDEIRNILFSYSVKNALINLGNSSVIAVGNHPHGKGWKVKTALQAFGFADKEFVLHNECLTTSGNDTPHRRHIICPDTGKYIEGLKAVSVVTSNATEGEVLSLAFFVATEEKQQKLLQNFPKCVFKHYFSSI